MTPRYSVTAPSAVQTFPVAARDAILAWYDAAGRSIAFRGVTDPYGVLVSETMAQQTQVARAAAAWVAWMVRFPTVRSLADAPLGDVLRAWAGLGYNRRAVNLQRAARIIVTDHAGQVPDRIEELEALPGIGPYTARAVGAIAFGQPVGAVDVNVRRVLGRVIAGTHEIAPATLQAVADDVVPPGRSADWTHAVMDVGALFCRPKPRCTDCPAAAWCRLAGEQTGAGDGSVTDLGFRADGSGAGLGRFRRAARARPASPPFPSTNRWLRGRLLAMARDLPDGAWIRLADPVGGHDLPAVRAALDAMAQEGLLEARVTGGIAEARLPYEAG